MILSENCKLCKPICGFNITPFFVLKTYRKFMHKESIKIRAKVLLISLGMWGYEFIFFLVFPYLFSNFLL